ncbi:MAG: hypothetical protein BroJett011_03850 [Chloroflexota bacterium]|nr:MAG: hypothetical protein BroJett011_03850 [Chloroflexota bacterium]
MTQLQVIEWFQAGVARLELLKGPLNFWGQSAPMPVRFCDGHGEHQGDLGELWEALHESYERLIAPAYSEDGPACGVTAQQAFVEIYAIIANAERVEGA